ncbi:hypothetical protein [Defluviimonas sp. D31]|nr:hypothetical protein [Defluviimonas sp. D31]
MTKPSPFKWFKTSTEIIRLAVMIPPESVLPIRLRRNFPFFEVIREA